MKKKKLYLTQTMNFNVLSVNTQNDQSLSLRTKRSRLKNTKQLDINLCENY